MREILFQYHQVAPTTWIYLSSLLLVALFFKFNRLWSVRNLDIVLLILLAPGLLLVVVGREQQQRATQVLQALDAAPPPDPKRLVERLFGESAGRLRPGTGGQANREGASDRPVDAPRDGEEESEHGRQSAEARRSAGGTRSENGPELSDSIRRAVAERWHEKGERIERAGFFWLLGTAAVVLLRLLVDSLMVRRPQLPPNLSLGGMIFMLVFFYLFLMANVIISRPTPDHLSGPVAAARWLSGERNGRSGLDRNGPGYAVLFMLPSLPTVPSESPPRFEGDGEGDPLAIPFRIDAGWWHDAGPAFPADGVPRAATGTTRPAYVTVSARYGGLTKKGEVVLQVAGGQELRVPRDRLHPESQRMVAFFRGCTLSAKTIAVVSHLAVLVGLIVVGLRHFGNLSSGVAVALIYMMLPYTSQMTGRVDHVLPAAVLLWALASYGRPVVAGVLLGLATGIIYYPLFLLPLWASFYWHRGLGRFLAGFLASVVAMLAILFAVSYDMADFWRNTQNMLGLMPPRTEGLQGIWGLGWPPVYRLTVLAAFVSLCGSLALWPAQKNFGTLLSCTAAVMVATQFWHGFGGGMYMAWYLPPMLLTFFRPNLEDRVAVVVLAERQAARSSRLAPVA